jgi:hypothetical protein
MFLMYGVQVLELLDGQVSQQEGVLLHLFCTNDRCDVEHT